jgi:hypothetical protein
MTGLSAPLVPTIAAWNQTAYAPIKQNPEVGQCSCQPGACGYAPKHVVRRGKTPISSLSYPHLFD